MDRRSFLAAASTASALAPASFGAGATQGPRRALVLTGGGALGAYQAGVLAGLEERGERFDIVVGTSIGAINGALFAQGDLAALTDLWASIARYRLIRSIPTLHPLIIALNELRQSWRGVISRPYNIIRGLVKLYDRGGIFDRTGFFESAPIASILAERLDLTRIRGTFGWSATNLTDLRNEYFYTGPFAPIAPIPVLNGPIHRLDPGLDRDRSLFPEAVRASAALPLVFTPVTLAPNGGTQAQYADGGVVANAPISLARFLGATDIVGVSVDPPTVPRPIRKLTDVIFATFSTNQTHLILDQLAPSRRLPAIRSIGLVQPATTLPLGPIGFDRQATIDDVFRLGYADGKAGPVGIPLPA